ncbi:MAG: nucleotidyltransferase family protein [Actinomycetota bacterium]
MSLLDGPEPTGRSDAPEAEVVAIILAAGRGQRFGGGTKQLAELAGRPLVAHAVEAAVEARAARILVVVGHDGQAVADAAREAAGDTPVEVVVNPDHAAGQGTSVAAGARAVAAAPTLPDAVVVLLADQPGIRPETVRTVAAAVTTGASAARASYADRPSHPVAFGPQVLDRLTTLTGDEGARQLLDELDVVHVLVAGLAPHDVDTPDDLAALRGQRVGPGGATQ